MRLLNTSTIALEEFTEENIPRYAILSHTWDKEEVSFRQMQDPDPNVAKNLKGYSKVRDCCKQALSEKYTHIWIDTCCIDKSSSAELSEAINSMFRWYRDAEACYAYLSDVPDDVNMTWANSPFHRSKWFSRGWTLQELLAPSMVYFFTSGWKKLGSKTLLRKQISNITRVDESILCGEEPINSASIAKRMSWAAGRKTTRPEDVAYCLLGIFEVNMPLLYGEGHKAFRRLQEEIVKVSTDQTIFAWGYKAGKPIKSFTSASIHLELSGADEDHGFFAESPSAFRDFGGDWVPDELSQATPYAITNYGLRINAMIVNSDERLWEKLDMLPRKLIIFACRPIQQVKTLLAIPVREIARDKFARFDSEPLAIDRDLLRWWLPREDIYLYVGLDPQTALTSDNETKLTQRLALLRFNSDPNRIFTFNFVLKYVTPEITLNTTDVYPAGSYDPVSRILEVKYRVALRLGSDHVMTLYRFSETFHHEVYKRRSLDVEVQDNFDFERWCTEIENANEANKRLEEQFTRSERFTVSWETVVIQIKTGKGSYSAFPLEIGYNYR